MAVTLGLNGATIMPASLDEDIAVAAEAGYDGLEIWAAKLDRCLERHSQAALAETFAAAGIVPWTINSIENITFGDRAATMAVSERCLELSVISRALGSPSIVLVPGPLPEGATRDQVIRETVRALRELSDVADGVPLSFEFIGRAGCSVARLDLALEIIEAVNRATVGLVIDTFHFHAGGSALADLSRVPLDRLHVLHINDAEPLPPAALTDAHRLYPGEGAIDLQGILSALAARGFAGHVSIELFRPEYWGQEPLLVARTARERTRGVLARAGLAAAGD